MNNAQLKTTDEYPSKQSVVLFCWRNGKVRWMSVAADFSLSLSASPEIKTLIKLTPNTLALHTQNCISTPERTVFEPVLWGFEENLGFNAAFKIDNCKMNFKNLFLCRIRIWRN